MGRYHPASKTIGRYHPASKTIGRNHPASKTIRRYYPASKTIGRYHPASKNGTLHYVHILVTSTTAFTSKIRVRFNHLKFKKKFKI